MKLFVFGTLMSGFSANALLGEDAEMLAGDVVIKNHMMFDLCFPGLFRVDKPDAMVLGEVWNVPEANIPRVDQYEGTPRLFKREQMLLEDMGPVIKAMFDRDPEPIWMYNYQWRNGVDIVKIFRAQIPLVTTAPGKPASFRLYRNKE